MRKLNFFVGLTFLGVLLSSCFNEETDKEKIVEMTVYPETGYSSYFMSDNVYGEFLAFSDSDNNEKRLLAHTIIEGFENFDYEEGYEYKLKVKKIWMHEPPQDVSSIKFFYLETLSSEKVINKDSEQEIELAIGSEKVQLVPRSESEIQETLLVKGKGEVNWWPLLEIEGFEYEEGYEYLLTVKKAIQADPYTIKFTLLNIISKEKRP